MMSWWSTITDCSSKSYQKGYQNSLQWSIHGSAASFIFIEKSMKSYVKLIRKSTRLQHGTGWTWEILGYEQIMPKKFHGQYRTKFQYLVEGDEIGACALGGMECVTSFISLGAQQDRSSLGLNDSPPPPLSKTPTKKKNHHLPRTYRNAPT